MRKLSRIKKIFLTSFLLFFSLILAVDIFFGTQSGTVGVITYSFTGSFFLALCLSIFSVTLLMTIKEKTRNSVIPWYSTSLICLLLIGFSFFAYNSDRRIRTESDGPSSVRYFCVWSELYETVDVLTNIYSDSSPHLRNETLCVLKNMPLATSNYSPLTGRYKQDLWDLSILTAYGWLIISTYYGSRFLQRKLIK